MTFKTKFPIRTKLLLLISGSVLMATTAYLLLAIQLFKEDKMQLVYELNASTVKTLAAETEAHLSKIIDKIKLLTQGHRDLNWIHAVFDSEPDLIAYTLYRQDSPDADWKAVTSLRNSDYLKLYGLSISEVEKIRTEIPVPFQKVVDQGVLLINSTLQGGAPILTLGMSIQVMASGGVVGKFIAVADLKMDHFLKLLEARSISTVYLVNEEGGVLAHPDLQQMISRQLMTDVPIVAEAIHSPISLQLKQFEWNGVQWLGAYSTVGIGGAIVISQIPESEAFHALQVLLKKSVIFALLVITCSLIMAGWVAHGFTEPLRNLLLATGKIAQWDFSQTIHVKTQDEIGGLARAFNSMSANLQNQRLQLDANHAELERKVAERTQALENEKKKFSDAQDALLRTTRLASLGELAGAAAHEVLNPVNNMSIRIERITKQLEERDKVDLGLMREILSSWHQAYIGGSWDALVAEWQRSSAQSSKPLGEEDLENLVAISNDLTNKSNERSEDMLFLGREIIRITRIINNMRSLSRVGGERRPLDVHIPVDETFLALGDLFVSKNVSLIRDFSSDPRDLFTVIGDKDEFVQVFSNLLRNSLHAVSGAHRRAGEVRVATSRVGDRIEIRVIDNGIGISKDNLAKLFESNFTTKSMQEGTGLGLSISRRFVRAFGGDLMLEKTEEGVGSTFLIWIPVAS